MRRLCLAAAFCLAGPATAATPQEVDRLWAAMQMPRVLEVMREEGLAYGASLDEEMLDGQGGARFRAAVGEIYDAARMEEISRAAFGALLEEADVTAATGFFEGPVGAKAIGTELDAREAMLDEEVDRAARDMADKLREDGDPRYDLVLAFAEANDLIESNVSGALNANLQFFRGLAAGGGLGPDMDEAGILQEVWSQESAVRADTESWVMGFLALAYQPLADEELRAYVAFSESPAGQELNRAMFGAFDRMFDDISFRLGGAVAEELTGQDL